MNDYALTDLVPGETEASFTQELTPGMLDAFCALSGDENPLHTDEAFARAHGFAGRVVYGMLTAALYSRLAGMYLPGRRCILQEVNSSFHKPVYAGDVLTVSGRVKDVDLGKGRAVVAAVVRNQDGARVSRAEIVVGILEEKA